MSHGQIAHIRVGVSRYLHVVTDAIAEPLVSKKYLLNAN